MASKTGKISFLKRHPSVRKLIISAVIGYIIGVVLTLIWFFFVTICWKVPIYKSTWISCILAIILTLGLAYNRNFRCTFFLILPNLCSVKGRSFLIAYAFVLAATGPCNNIIQNIEIMSKSLTCGQEQLKTALKDMLDVINAPLIAVKNALKIVLDELKKILYKIEEAFKEIVEIVKKILVTIKAAFSWLGNIVSVCNKEVGTPFDRCMKIAEEAIEDCRKKLGVLKSLCKITKVFQALCYSVKFIDVICILVDFVSDSIIGEVTQRLKAFQETLKNIFYVSVKFDHDFYFTTKSDRDWSEVGSDILNDFRQKSKSLFIVFGWLEIISSVMFLRLVLK